MASMADQEHACPHGIRHETKLTNLCKISERHEESIKRAHIRMDNAMTRGLFFTIVGVMVTVLIASMGYQYTTLSRIDKNVAVLAERSEGIKASISILSNQVDVQKAWNETEHNEIRRRITKGLMDKP